MSQRCIGRLRTILAALIMLNGGDIAMSEEAREALHDDGAALQAQLEVRTKRAYERALRMTATMGRRFIGEWQALRPRRARSRRVLPRKSS